MTFDELRNEHQISIPTINERVKKWKKEGIANRPNKILWYYALQELIKEKYAPKRKQDTDSVC